ncbi:hypothetical protein [Thaumasiovibrio sp. DFM-14]|uniref:hypothetical protein n=1 Tax=Thaumasiovibrio sp. DFM-14 TaxID=3384792 RepID=UPI0039A03BE8
MSEVNKVQQMDLLEANIEIYLGDKGVLGCGINIHADGWHHFMTDALKQFTSVLVEESDTCIGCGVATVLNDFNAQASIVSDNIDNKDDTAKSLVLDTCLALVGANIMLSGTMPEPGNIVVKLDDMACRTPNREVNVIH